MNQRMGRALAVLAALPASASLLSACGRFRSTDLKRALDRG